MARIFDWLDLVQRQGIDHIERGPNVKRGEINIRCPFCGSADPSYHMGLSLSTGFWACWRNKSHRGKSPLRLLMRLLLVPYWKARQLAGLDDTYVDPEGFDAVAARVMGRDLSMTRMEQVQRDYLSMPDEFDLIVPRGQSRLHWRYLQDTRLFGDFTADAIERYLLLYATTGSMWYRVIFPYITNGELVSWSGRDISGQSPLRYRDLELDECLIKPKENLYNHDAIISGGKVLCVVEGPIDTVKIDLFGANEGVRAVGLSTNSMSDEQLWLLTEAADNFDKLVVLMDEKKSGLGLVDSMRMKAEISSIKNATIMPVPLGAKDAGEYTPQQAVEAVRIIKERVL